MLKKLSSGHSTQSINLSSVYMLLVRLPTNFVTLFNLKLELAAGTGGIIGGSRRILFPAIITPMDLLLRRSVQLSVPYSAIYVFRFVRVSFQATRGLSCRAGLISSLSTFVNPGETFHEATSMRCLDLISSNL